jgi:penicillin G amidase
VAVSPLNASRFTFARRAPNHVLGIAFVVLFFATTLAVFAFLIASRSASKTDGEEAVTGIAEEIRLYRNDYGIVHIIATTDRDAYFGIGYAHAQDRLWQMDFLRRVGRGRLSELFGRRTIEQDIVLRAMRFDTIATQLYRTISPESRAVLQAYSDGVNVYMTTHTGKLPFEFDALEGTPDVWTPQDCLLLLRLWAFEMNTAFMADVVLTAIAENSQSGSPVGRERTLDLIPPDASNDAYLAPVVLDSVVPIIGKQNSMQAAPVLDTLKSDSLQNVQPTGTTATIPVRATFQKLLAIFSHVRKATQMQGSGVGSNTWAVRSSAFFHPDEDSIHTRSTYRHGALLASDAHAALTAPGRWYEAHLTSPSLNVVGLTLPGLPFVLIGRNDRIAWGIANLMLDDVDFFREHIDPSNTRQYQTTNGVQRFKTMTDTVHVKDSSNVVVDVRYTWRSAVLSDFADPAFASQYALPGMRTGATKRGIALPNPNIATRLQDSLQLSTQKPLQTYTERLAATQECLTFQWTGQQMSDEVLALLRLNQARSLEEAAASMQTFSVPALALTLADREGSCGVLAVGGAPIRLEQGVSTHPNFVRRGSDSADAWQGTGLLPLQSITPPLWNPPSGRVIAANNRFSRTSSAYGGVHWSNLWDTPTRASRIGECLQEFEHYSVQAMSIVQNDVRSHYARQLVPLMLQALKATSATATASVNTAQNLTFTERRALALLQSWNYELESTSPAALVYSAFVERFAYNTFADEMGEDLYHQYAAVTRLPLRSLLMLATRTETDVTVPQRWFDDRSTQYIAESRDDIIRKSFREAVTMLQRRMRTENNADSVEGWHYGRLHRLAIPHTLSNTSGGGAAWTAMRLNGASTLRSEAMNGDASTVNASEWSLNATLNHAFEPVLGASARFVCDMNDTLAYMIVAGGNSGEIMTRNHSDQLPLWLNGGLLPVPVAREAHPSFTRCLRLVRK